MKVKALVPLFGSNRMLASEAAALLDGCCWVGIPFAGGMCEVAHMKARTLVINDLHRHIINLAMIARHPAFGPMLIRDLRRLPYHPDQLRHSQEHCVRVETRGMAEDPEMAGLEQQYVDALNYFVCAWMGRHGDAGTEREFRGGLAIRWNAAGGDNVQHFRSGIEALRDWRKILARATFTCMDGFAFLEKCKDAEGHGIYCDPPFPGPGDAYKHRFTHECHRRLAEVLGAYQQTRVVCRYYDVAFIRALYPEPRWRWQRLKGRKQTNAEAPEVLIVNGPAY